MNRQLVFFYGFNAMSTAFIYTYVENTFVKTKILNHSPNRQLNQQPGTEWATGKKRASKP